MAVLGSWIPWYPQSNMTKAGQLGGGRTETAVPTGRHKFCRVIHSCSWSRMDGFACLRKVNQVTWRCRPQPTIKRRYKSHLSMHMNSTRYVGGATPGSSVQLRGSPRLTRASTVFLPLLWCFWEEGGLGAWCWLRPPPRVLPFHTSNTRERNANGCNLLLHALHRANRQSNSCVCCWCVVAVPPESPLKIAASFFLGLRPSTCSLRVCSVTPTAILHFQPWGKTRKCKI